MMHFMKPHAWSEEKNEWLKEHRYVCFEDVEAAIDEGRMLTVITHPNQQRHPKQKMYIVAIGDYAYVVPYVEDDQKIFLKTVFPSRKYTKQYLEKGDL